VRPDRGLTVVFFLHHIESPYFLECHGMLSVLLAFRLSRLLDKLRT